MTDYQDRRSQGHFAKLLVLALAVASCTSGSTEPEREGADTTGAPIDVPSATRDPASSTSPSEDEPAWFAEHGVTFVYPDDWRAMDLESPPEPIWQFAVTPDRSSGNYISFTYLPGSFGATEETYLRDLNELDAEGFFRIVRGPNEIEISGRRGLEVSVDGITGKRTGQELSAETVVLFSGSASYLLSVQYEPASKDVVLSAWENMLLNLELPEPGAGANEDDLSPVPDDGSVLGGSGSQWIYGVTAGGPGLVAVGYSESEGDDDAAVWTSVDGFVWSRISHDEAVMGGAGDQTMYGVTAGGPGLVAVGSDWSGGFFDGGVWTSPDGFTWSQVPDTELVLGGAGDQVLGSVVSAGPGLVAVGWETSDGDQDAAVWTSVDGFTWSRVTHDEASLGGTGDQEMITVVSGGPGLVAVGRDGSGGDDDAAVWTSVDGVSWSRVTHDEASFGGAGHQWMYSAAASGPVLVAVGFESSGRGADAAAVWTSVDGLTWSRVARDEANGAMFSLAVGGPGLVAVGGKASGANVDAAVWTSVDGFTWSEVTGDDTERGTSP